MLDKIMLAKLRNLDPTFVGHYSEVPTVSYYILEEKVEGAQGLLFTCPKCGNHSILCWFNNPRNAPKVPDSASPGPGRWTFSGETFDTLTLTPSVDSSKNRSGCHWHGNITNGEVS